MRGDDTGTPSFRALYQALVACEGVGVAASGDVLVPWLPKARQALDSLRHYGRLNSPLNGYAVEYEDLHQWYALSRVSDHLLLSVQVRDDSYVAPSSRPDPWREWMTRIIAPEEYVAFFEVLGFHSFTRLPFSPFHHEIVEVIDTPDADGVSVDHVFWPGLMFGDMLFSRAGVRVRCPASLIDKAIAETSCLYFTHRRLRRRTSDLSHGWGSNSQWVTSFRRDYDSGGRFWYNVDGEHPLGDGYRASFPPNRPLDEDDLTMAQRVELLTNRCFVRCPKDGSDLFPFGDQFTEPKPWNPPTLSNT